MRLVFGNVAAGVLFWPRHNPRAGSACPFWQRILEEEGAPRQRQTGRHDALHLLDTILYNTPRAAVPTPTAFKLAALGPGEKRRRAQTGWLCGRRHRETNAVAVAIAIDRTSTSVSRPWVAALSLLRTAARTEHSHRQTPTSFGLKLASPLRVAMSLRLLLRRAIFTTLC